MTSFGFSHDGFDSTLTLFSTSHLFCYCLVHYRIPSSRYSVRSPGIAYQNFGQSHRDMIKYLTTNQDNLTIDLTIGASTLKYVAELGVGFLHLLFQEFTLLVQT